MLRQYPVQVDTRGRGTLEVTAQIEAAVRESGIRTGGKLGLGTWQGVYLYEHRTSPHRRRLTVTVAGE